jgi:hypothetical protein
VAQVLRVKIVNFETAVVDVGCWVCGHEECVVIGVPLAEVDVKEDGDVEAAGRIWIHVEEICGYEVEGCGVPF